MTKMPLNKKQELTETEKLVALEIEKQDLEDELKILQKKVAEQLKAKQLKKSIKQLKNDILKLKRELNGE